MRYLIFGDVHANYEALNTVLREGEQRGVNAYLFVGDLIGYGPNPLECIQLMLGLQQRGGFAWVAGNHELALLGRVPTDGYSVEARKTLDWTRQEVEAEPWALKFLEAAPLSSQINNDIWLTHESLLHPGSAQYNRNPGEAHPELETLAGKGGRVCFYGHTHRLRAEMMRQDKHIVLQPVEAHEGDGQDQKPVRVPPGGWAWVGVGSVGFPTNPGRKAEFLILDDTDWCIEKYAVTYPRERTKARVAKTFEEPCGTEVAQRIARWL